MSRAIALAVMLSVVVFSGCKAKEEEKKGPLPTIITVTQAKQQTIQIVEEAVGTVDSESAPTVAAEVPGKVEKVFVDLGQSVNKGQPLAQLNPRDLQLARQSAAAEVNRLEALMGNQQRLTKRYGELVEQKFISPTQYDQTKSELKALQEQLSAARARLAAANQDVSKTRIVAPVAGKIEQRLIEPGDYATVGKPLFQIATSQNLRVRLPFPETALDRVRPGMKVNLSSPAAPGAVVHGQVEEIRPMIGAANRSFEAIVSVANPGGWSPGASVTGKVVVAERPNAVTVPDTSIVLRPAGSVVYVIANNKAQQRVVEPGAKQDGVTEIRSGLEAGTTVALDGAGFLTDGALVKVQGAQKTPDKKKE